MDEPLTRRHQIAVAVIVGVCLAILSVSMLSEQLRRRRRINIDRPFDVHQVKLTIDINSAAWPELTLLPEISETMARRIVNHRESNGKFSSIDAIQQVKGIGPRTFARIEPYLSPVAIQPKQGAVATK